ncbi:MAG: Imm51 family immunity protein [Actinomycetales bacterium]
MTEHLTIFEPDDDQDTYTLYMPADVPGDVHVEESGHLPNGYFWEGVLDYLVQTTEPGLGERYETDSEADTFVVESSDRDVVERLAALLAPYVSGNADVVALVAAAEADGYEFDD